MPRSLLILALFISSSVLGSVDTRKLFTKKIMANFGPEDSLCFDNIYNPSLQAYTFMESAGRNPYLKLLAAVAEKEGACQGMVGVAAAIKTRAIFRPDRPKMSAKKIKKQVSRSVSLHKNNCGGKIYIDGYSNLKELCLDHEKVLRRRSLQYNLSLAVNEILPKSRTFFFKRPLSRPSKARAHILKELLSLHEDLANGEFPLLLERTHVTLATDMRITRDSEGYVQTIAIQRYDPNVIIIDNLDLEFFHYHFSKDGTEISGPLIWNISPRYSKLGCLFSSTDVKKK